MSFADDIISLFVAGGLGLAGTTLFIGPKAVVPSDSSLVVTPTGGFAPEGTHNSVDVPAYVRPTAQIVARGLTSAAAETLIGRAYQVLFPVRNQFVNGVWYRSITIVQEPFPLGEDENDLIRWAFNINIVKRFS